MVTEGDAIEEVTENGQKLHCSDLSLYEAFIKLFGVRLDQVTPNATFGQLGYISIYNKKVWQIVESLGFPKERELELTMEKQASWIIWEHLDRVMRREKRAHGSNLQDKHMGVLALFVDVFTADKRVHEYFKQLSRKKPDVFACLGGIAKLSSYSDLGAIA